MMKSVVVRLALSLFLIVAAIFSMRDIRPVDLPEPVRQESRMDGCVVSEESTEVHDKEGKKNYEEAWIDYVNNDGTVQVSTIETKLSLLFGLRPSSIKCFRPGSLAQVTIVECEKKEEECDFTLPHKVYVRTEPVEILNWKYLNGAL